MVIYEPSNVLYMVTLLIHPDRCALSRINPRRSLHGVRVQTYACALL